MAQPGYVLKNRRTTFERIEKFISPIYFTDCNLYGRLYPLKSELTSLTHSAASGRISFDDAKKASYATAAVGQSFGPTWSTHWFHLHFEIPDEWKGRQVHLVWDSSSEAMLWSEDGRPLQGFTPENKRTTFPLSNENFIQSYYVEMACNGLFGAGHGSQIAPPDPNASFTLKSAHIAVRDELVHQLWLDFQVLFGFIQNVAEDSLRGKQALYVANEMINVCIEGDHSTSSYKTDLAKGFFSQKNGDGAMTVCAVGNCHIDSAWLWPYDETIRKCARSFSSTIRLLEKYPDYTFACSQAQQFEWVKSHYPSLYNEIRHYVKQGRFIPVGGCWIEMDGNIPSGESFIRQFLYGQKFFQEEFGITCKEFWLPDTFGYSAQLPQIMRLSGIERFVTQKISWNIVNKFPHHTFWWKGIDGSRVLTHFPPGDSYTMNAEPKEILFTEENFKDKGRSDSSLYLYGWGDGGQGPTAEMIERLQRMKDFNGLPKVEFSSPEEFFHRVEDHDSRKLCNWSGELYLEMHNGTYTTQAKTKAYNRQCELLLRSAEALSCLALLKSELTYPAEEIERIWKLTLLNQFHDVLPGSSINMVYKDAIKYYKDVVRSADKIIKTALPAINSAEHPVAVNLLSWPRSTLLYVTDEMQNASLMEVAAFGYTPLNFKQHLLTPCSAVIQDDDSIQLRSSDVRAVIDPLGRLTHLYLANSSHNAIADGQYANQLVIFDDVPLYWDAWDVMDYHLETRKPVETVIEKAIIREDGPLRASVEVKLMISDHSYVQQIISVEAQCPYIKFETEVHWHENHKFLKVEFPANVLSGHATYDIQYGHLQRPTHMNTSWDSARYEVCGHKWADLSQHNFGLAVLNDSKYGWSCLDNVLRLSLLRSSKSPDEMADMGVQTFTYAAMPHTGSFQDACVNQAAYELNNPVLTTSLPGVTTDPFSFIEISDPAIVLETLKKAEGQSSALVLRMYESHGGSTTAHVRFGFPVKEARVCNALEVPHDEDWDHPQFDLHANHMYIHFSPFQIVSLLLTV
ncbi:hypothetical protein CAPTEDRAFT_182455 [Capitella teleta]|uniref:alpha-mannosidase n=1 Tax=Capitella teleta TaxID=283909 RepID=R7VBI6_CAPTE|nr:hypothetical protein CAPTEDRAFT_182455 [Capitella teleta]|eukprot:ELU16163.1 hypothetical protein CAPTEDRAFT_182455 [Capitella teleta]